MKHQDDNPITYTVLDSHDNRCPHTHRSRETVHRCYLETMSHDPKPNYVRIAKVQAGFVLGG